MPETDDKRRPGDLARALTAVVPEGSTAALVDTSSAAVERLIAFLSTGSAVNLYEYPGGPAPMRAFIRALAAERDALARDDILPARWRALAGRAGRRHPSLVRLRRDRHPDASAARPAAGRGCVPAVRPVLRGRRAAVLAVHRLGSR